MSNSFDLMRQALSEACMANQAADRNAQFMAELLCGRLRHVSPYTLKRLKRELRDFNIHTRAWKP